MRAVPHLCDVYPGIYLTTEEEAWKNVSQGSRRVMVFFERETADQLFRPLGYRDRSLSYRNRDLLVLLKLQSKRIFILSCYVLEFLHPCSPRTGLKTD